MKIVYLGDNRPRVNWGCRGTSKALKDLFSVGHNVIYTIDAFVTNHYDMDYVRGYKTDYFADRLRMAFYHRNHFRKQLLADDPFNVIKDTVEDSYTAFKKMTDGRPPRLYREIDDNLRQCDALVCNGEGTFIFTNPPRYDSVFYALMFRLAQEYGKKTFLLNAMFSDCPATGHNEQMLEECKGVFLKCTGVTARDPLSYSYYKQHIGDNVSYVPDALFTWTKYAEYVKLAPAYSKALTSFPEYDEKFNLYDFKRPYICLSGSSLAAWNQREAERAYTKLTGELKKHFRVYIVPTCGGDAFLNKVADNTGCPVVPVNTNILFGMSILANADVFVSGRWHPSILASLGGTPCVLMGSNSHKTLALQYMLNYQKMHEYSAIPSDDEIHSIVADCQAIIAEGVQRRLAIKDVVKSLSEMAAENTPPSWLTTSEVNFFHLQIQIAA